MRTIPIADAAGWRLEDGALVHRTGGFFSVRGLRISATGSIFDRCQMPVIDQPEVGLLGFVVATGGEDMRWLIQAKSEPGTVGWVQAAPTVQATRSNYIRRHRGAPTRFLDRFPIDEDGSPAGKCNSEQGNRFLNKFNCNATVTVTDVFDTEDSDWSWFAANDLRDALARDFMVNTDARSVIATGDWALLRKVGQLFSGPTWADPDLGLLRDALGRSHSQGRPDPERAQTLLGQLIGAAPAEIQLTRVPLGSLTGWTLEREGLRRTEEVGFAGGVQMFTVEAPRREVRAWDQPFLIPAQEERVSLLLSHVDGHIRIALRTVAEHGFRGRREFGPSFQTDGDCPDEVRDVLEDPAVSPIMTVRQSDEGGRFMRAIVNYNVVLIDESQASFLGGQVTWVHLGEMEWLCRTPAVTTNELRSAISVLLSLS